MTIPTRDEFIDLQIAARRAEKASADAFETNTGIPEALSKLLRSRENVLAAYDALAARIQAADAEVVEFNAGFDAYGAGVPVENEPSDTAHDVWRVGWAWAAFPHLTARVAELEAQLDAVATVLLERGCEGVVHECAVLEAQVRELEAMR